LWSFAYGRDFTASLSAGARYLHSRQRNAGHIQGVNRTEDRWLLEARYGF